MPHIDRVNVASLTRLADIAGTHDRLVATAEGGIQTSGRVSAFFTAKATHRQGHPPRHCRSFPRRHPQQVR